MAYATVTICSGTVLFGLFGSHPDDWRNSMKIIAVNGSPRKTWNTATLLHHALDGAASRAPKRNWFIYTIWISRAASAVFPVN
jgi:hypothetical protein